LKRKLKKEIIIQEPTDMQENMGKPKDKEKNKVINPIAEFNESLTKFGDKDIVQRFEIFRSKDEQDKL
jgi:hypothetical protein